MIWLTLILVLANRSHCKGNDFLSSSVSDTIRMGATITSRFFNPKPFEFISSGFRKLTEGNGDGRNKFIFITLKLLGVDDKNISDLTFNGIISAVRLMSQVLLKNGEKSRKGKNSSKSSSLFHFIVTQPQVVDLLKQMEDPNLVDLILKESKENLKNFPEEKVQCLQLLMCKMKPFVREMQRSLRFFMMRENVPISVAKETCWEGKAGGAWERASLEDRMFFFVPKLSDVIEEGDKCDLQFPNCIF